MPALSEHLRLQLRSPAGEAAIPAYAVEREIEDIGALIQEAADRFVFGGSSGVS
jgi:hypothetical protein